MLAIRHPVAVQDQPSEAVIHWEGSSYHIRIEKITPERAAEYLVRNIRNRPVNKNSVKAIGRALSGNEWFLNGETIIFTSDGYLLDGQHRLLAIVETGISAVTFVITDIPQNAFSTIDLTLKRSKADSLAISGEINCTALASTLGMASEYLSEELRIYSRPSRQAMSPTMCQNFLNDHPEIKDSVHYAVSRGKNSVVSVMVCGFCHWLFSSIDAADAEEFMASFISGENLQKGNAILALRTVLLSRKKGTDLRGSIMAAYVVMAWNRWRKHENCLILRLPSVDTEFPKAI